MAHVLKAKLPAYLRRLQMQYASSPETYLLRDLIVACRYGVEEETEYDNWNGGTYGHDVRLHLTADVISRVAIAEQSKIGEAIRGDLNILAESVQNEFFSAVHLEMADENDPNYLKSVAFSHKASSRPGAVDFWSPGLVRLFISHRDQHKAAANEIAGALQQYGISSFVAHDTIQPMTEWRKEIMKGLETMELMLLFLTDDFEDSTWTNQEVGFALGRGVPIISLKMGRKDPPGFVSHEQALKVRSTIANTAHDLFPLIAKTLGRRERMQEALVRSFVLSPDFSETKARFDRMEKHISSLTAEEEAAIVLGFRTNDQLFNAVYLSSRFERLKKFMNRVTGKDFDVAGKVISVVKKSATRQPFTDDDIPF